MRVATLFVAFSAASAAQMARISNDVLFGNSGAFEKAMSENAFTSIASNKNVRQFGKMSVIQASSVEQRFHQEIRSYSGKGAFNQELPAIRKALEPMWIALPKNEDGKLTSEQVYKAVGDVVQERLDLALEAELNSASEDGLLSRMQLTGYLLNMFEEIFGQEGLMLHEVTLLAATMEGLLLDESLWQNIDAPAEVDLALPAKSDEVSCGLMATVLVAGILIAGADAAKRFGGASVYKGKVYVQ